MRKENLSARWLTAVILVLVLAASTSILTEPLSAQSAAANDSVHLFFFTNPGCAPCRQVEPAIEALIREGYPVTKLFLNEQPQYARQFSVDRTPTVIMVANNKIVGRHAGLIDGVTLKQWFAAVGVASGKTFSNQSGGTKVSLAPENRPEKFADRPNPPSTFAGSSTLHNGTAKPGNELERRALDATVRLKVEDPEGISYATGTVIHRHDGECLVMTCGHVFRDANGKGEITAEFGFANGEIQSAPGQLISYDAKARDIGLVAIRTDYAFEPVVVAAQDDQVQRGQNIFSIGCDHGESPTIRHSQIKNRAAYDGAVKYDIFGRPVDGRSGGGLFNEQGELIGVCNAAAVEVDEGIYTALETLHWQIAEVKLEHLFEDSATFVSKDRVAQNAGQVAMPVDGATQTQTVAANGSDATSNGLARIKPFPSRQSSESPAPVFVENRLEAAQPQQNLVSWGRQNSADSTSDMEVIIIVRSKSDPSRTEAITVNNPSEQLLDYLDEMQANNNPPRQVDVAQLRRRIAFEELPVRR